VDEANHRSSLALLLMLLLQPRNGQSIVSLPRCKASQKCSRSNLAKK